MLDIDAEAKSDRPCYREPKLLSIAGNSFLDVAVFVSIVKLYMP